MNNLTVFLRNEINDTTHAIFFIKDSDGEAGIALVGVHTEYPKYTTEEKFNEEKGPATVG